jgi:hypothetical protein
MTIVVLPVEEGHKKEKELAVTPPLQTVGKNVQDPHMNPKSVMHRTVQVRIQRYIY